LEDITAKISYYAPYMLQIVQAVAKYNKEVKHTFCCEFINCTEAGVDILHVSSQCDNTRKGKYNNGTSAKKFEGHCAVTRIVGFSCT
jgi:hypothetical protein